MAAERGAWAEENRRFLSVGRGCVVYATVPENP
jgi:hypothetical protein